MRTSSANRRFVFGDFRHCLAFGLGAGLTPKMPGTAGTLLAYPLYWVMSPLPVFWQAAAAAAFFAFGIWLCEVTERALGRHDDGGIVCDEIVAFYAVLVFIPDDWRWQAAAFALFRILDAAKPPPIGWCDKHIGGGLGVMTDDAVAAGLTVGAITGGIWAAGA